MNCGSEDGRPRDVQNTRGKTATESRNRLNDGQGEYIQLNKKLRVSLPVLVCDVSSVVKGQHIKNGHGNDTVVLKRGEKNHHRITTMCR